jgi:hypothetical protein
MGNDNFGSSQRTRRRATGVSTLRGIAGEPTRRGIPTAGRFREDVQPTSMLD